MLGNLIKQYKDWLDKTNLASSSKEVYVMSVDEQFQSTIKYSDIEIDIIKKANQNDQNGLIKLHNLIIKNRNEYYKKFSFRGIGRFENFLKYKTEIIHTSEKISFNYPKNQIIFQGPPGTGKTRQAKDIAYQMIFNSTLSTENLIRSEQLQELVQTTQFKLIQFHPAYSYEDFVRGITAKSNGNAVEYKTENKVLALLAQAANENYLDSQKEVEVLSKELWVQQKMNDYADSIQDKIDTIEKFIIGDTTTYIFDVEEDAFRYKGDNWGMHNKGLRMKFKDLIQMYMDNIQTRQEIKRMTNVSGLSIQHASYSIKILADFRDFLKDKEPYQLTQKIELKNYVLIIDEINRANLPAVLGELIYALEYRGEPVHSMYDIDGETEIVLPPNLYIIGTMNTADRSVGHIDYAIRRRFAFVDVLPDTDVVAHATAKIIFTQLQSLFEEHTSSDFEAKDVALGHSYFIVKDDAELKQKLQYEVLPILHEYIKDGVLNKNEETTTFITDLKRSIQNLSA